MEGLERLRAKFSIDLHPSKLSSSGQGVKAHLASLLLRYNEDLEGVVLAYRNVRVLEQAAIVQPYFPLVRVAVAADVVLFRPRAGMRLVGMVNKVGADYVGLLVLGFINASVAADQMRPELRPRLAEHCWASTKAPKHRLEAGTKVHFDVHAVRHHGRFVSIAGSLLHPGTGAEGFAKPPEPKAARGGGGGRPQQAGKQQQAQPEQQSEKKKKKKKKEKVAAAQQQQAAAAPPPAAQQQQQQGGGAVAAAAPPAAEGSGKKGKKEKKAKKDKKRDRSPAAAPAAADTGGAEQPRRKKKKHA